MSFDYLVKELFPILPADPAMYTNLCLQFREQPFQGVVGVRKTKFWPVIEGPQKWHIPFQTEVCTA